MLPELLGQHEYYDIELNEQDVFFSAGGLFLIHFTESFIGYGKTKMKLYEIDPGLKYGFSNELAGPYDVRWELDITNVNGKNNYYLQVVVNGEKRVGVGKDGPLVTIKFIYDLKKKERIESLNDQEVEQIERNKLIQHQIEAIAFGRRVEACKEEKKSIRDGEVQP